MMGKAYPNSYIIKELWSFISSTDTSGVTIFDCSRTFNHQFHV